MRLFLVFFLVPCIFFGQEGDVTFDVPGGNPLVLQTKEGRFSSADVVGSPYLEEEFKPGKVFVYDAQKMEAFMRYNAYTSEVEIKKISGEPSSLLKKGYVSAIIDRRKYEILHYEDANGKVRTAYFNQLNKGKLVLLFKPEVKLKRGKQPATSYDRKELPKYMDVSSYWFKRDDAVAQKITLRKKWVIKLVEDRREQMRIFVEDNKLNLKLEKDVIKLFDYYNSL